ncbi:MAG: molybdopterin oxidoreductase family protein, partial [Chloroflexota bacterium]
MSSSLVYGACPLDCPDTCGVITEVENGKAVKFYGDPHHAITNGWLCTKVRPYLSHVYNPDRLMTPLRRTNGKSEAATWAPISWDEAIDEICSKWKAIGETYGYEAILPYSYSGT